MLSGFLAVNKPSGIPSFRLVSRLRKLLGVKKIGFAGTLDPFATGLMIMGIGREYTRQLDAFHNFDKTYVARCRLGMQTDTLDSDGQITEYQPFLGTKSDIEHVMSAFVTTYAQKPPSYSAKKIDGKPAYLLARKGIDPDLPTQDVTISSLKVLDINDEDPQAPVISFEVSCSKGTYIRQLVKDIAVQLCTLGYTDQLCRTRIGGHTLDQAVSWDEEDVDKLREALFFEVGTPHAD